MAGSDIEKAGPWLAPLTPETAEAIWGLLAEKPHAGVFWHCPYGQDALHHHLRTINQAYIPSDESVVTSGAVQPSHDLVLFRHYDPTVLLQLLPLMDIVQLRRLFGGERLMLVWAPDHGGLRWSGLPVKAKDVPVPAGFIRFTAEQMAQLQQVRVNESRQRIWKYLRTSVPIKNQPNSDKGLHEAVVQYETEARAMGVTGDRGFAHWAYMRMTSMVDLRTQPRIVNFIMNDAKLGTPDIRLNMIYQLRDWAARGLM